MRECTHIVRSKPRDRVKYVICYVYLNMHVFHARNTAQIFQTKCALAATLSATNGERNQSTCRYQNSIGFRKPPRHDTIQWITCPHCCCLYKYIYIHMYAFYKCMAFNERSASHLNWSPQDIVNRKPPLLSGESDWGKGHINRPNDRGGHRSYKMRITLRQLKRDLLSDRSLFAMQMMFAHTQFIV